MHLRLARDSRQLRREAGLAVRVHRAGRRRPRDAARRRCGRRLHGNVSLNVRACSYSYALLMLVGMSRTLVP